MNIKALDKVLDNRFRLGIILLILQSEEVGYTMLKRGLEISDGNLASHLKVLERNDYIGLKKKFIGRKPNTIYYLTLKGRGACESHIRNLKRILRKVEM